MENNEVIEIGDTVRLNPDVEDDYEMHRGKHFKVIKRKGNFIMIEWHKKTFLFMPHELQIVNKTTNLK